MPYCRTCGIPTRGCSEKCKSCAAKKGERRPDLYQDRDWLYENYVEKKLSLSQLAEMAKCSPQTIWLWLDEWKIPFRTRQEINHATYTHGRLSTPEAREKKNEAIREAHNKLEFRRRRSEVTRAAWARGCYSTPEAQQRRAEAHTRISLDPEVNRKRSETHQALWQTPERQKAHQQEMHRRHTTGVYDGVYKNPSKPELAVAETLDALNIPYQTQFRPEGMSRPFDFFLVGTNILIEVQGVYWHSGEEMKTRDQEKAREAKQCGYQTLEIWEDTIWDLGVEEAVKVVLMKVDVLTSE